MNLVLTLVQSPAGGAPVTRRFEDAALRARGVTLGRRPDNDWVLPNDTGVSRNHCQIVFDQGVFALIDASSFGSIVNERRLGRGERTSLQEGDRIILGEYAFAVSLEMSETSVSGRARIPESPPPAFPELDLENDPPGPFDPAASSPFGDPFPPQQILTDDIVYSDDISAEKEAFALPKRTLLPDDADILGDLRPATEPARAAPPQADGLSQFLKGAGLSRIETGDSNAKLRNAGEAYRAAIDGICAILAARDQFKTEVRVDKTQFGAARNNPLKSKAPLDDVVANMVGGRQGFTPAPDAMREALEDIKAHEMALVAAIQVALAQLLEQIDPERLEQRLEKRSIFDGLPGLKKARLWEVYETTYAEIAGELAEDFHGTFGKAFAEAYAKYFRGK